MTSWYRSCISFDEWFFSPISMHLTFFWFVGDISYPYSLIFLFPTYPCDPISCDIWPRYFASPCLCYCLGVKPSLSIYISFDNCLLLTIHLLIDDSLTSLLIRLLVSERFCLPHLTLTCFDIIDPSFLVYFVLKIFFDYLLILLKIAPP